MATEDQGLLAQTSLDESAPNPVLEESAPNPVLEESAPNPVLEESEPNPVLEESEPNPVLEESGPNPVLEESEPNPVLEESGPNPVLEESAPDQALEESAPDQALAEYRAKAKAQARNYDRTQDISPQQMLILLEVSERTGASLGQALATGEFESAKTWNDFVRPTLGSGRLGSATGVWQFIPSTFHLVIKKYGGDLLTASAADETSGRAPLDLGAGPFSDAQVRAIIQETVAGVRGRDDEQLQLLRHNFTVLAFSKHYLSVESGAKTPEEDYLFHFLGEGRGRQILALARGEARHTLCVKQPSPATEPMATPEPVLADIEERQAILRARSILRSASIAAADSATAGQGSFATLPRISARYGLSSGLQQHALGSRAPSLGDSAIYRPSARLSPGSAVWSSPDVVRAPRVSSEWGLPADSPVVTGNAGMFYRDGSAKTDPYTWAEFMSALTKRVQSKRQPAMVRAKYGVGFQLEGGDMPGWTLGGDNRIETTELHHEISGSLEVPKKLITGPLDAAETREYKERLAQLIRQGEDTPLATLPPPVASALQHLGILSPDVEDFETDRPEIREALSSFRELVGKDQPDDPALVDRLMPAERVALEMYEQRVARYAALQLSQEVAMQDALDLMGIKRLLKRHRRASKPHIAALQEALAEEGLQTQTHGGGRAKRAHFDGIAGKLTVGALDRFQLRHGLRQTHGLLDPVTVAMLGLPPMGRDIFLTPSGPQCPIQDETETALTCETPKASAQLVFYSLIPGGEDSLPDWPELLLAEADLETDAQKAPSEPPALARHPGVLSD
ncbi:peptidoglycan-binding protein [Thiorhodococcus mannitoliphagus]|uniref:Peptidoglycan-binding protein n=1 Tax=Thiorhodococcus mannitoliphagus TaxID=329406 RepID=A0A6P1DRE4_9GAMM|nr:peptidoglycan-binding domain-containing protein [Thiorhodococcus mannitoliphagus]NEX20817.1 peptidoglycan-binding protein [Thiorhodococcus mannitoliphagus]